jgi:NAD+ kinase
LKRIGLVIKASNPEAIKLGEEIAMWGAARGVSVSCEVGLSEIMETPGAIAPDEFPGAIDLMVVLGGDGTMLHAVRLLDGRNVPVLGVNLGSLGFLTAITAREVFPLLDEISAGNFVTNERMLLSVTVERDGKSASYKVLNDAVIKGENARLVNLETRINQEYVNTYRADGLIVATPTGSTAYSLSANGPILYPTIHSIIVAPICPFNLTNRPVVIPDWMKVEIRLPPEQTRTGLILDGQVDVPLSGGDRIIVQRAEQSAYLIRCEGKSYFDILRERLMWEVGSVRR